MGSPAKILPTDPIKRKAWASTVYQDSHKASYYSRMTGKELSPAVIVRKENLQDKGKGDEVTTTLIAKLIGTPLFSGDRAEGRELTMSHATHTMRIDEMRQFVNLGSDIEDAKVGHNTRSTGRAALAALLKEYIEESITMALNGARGSGDEIQHFPTGFSGRPNPLRAPDAAHHFIGDGSKTVETLTSNDKMSLDVINRLVAKSKTMLGGVSRGKPQRIEKTVVGGEKVHILAVGPEVMYDIRKDVGDTGWAQAQRALTTKVGRDAELFKGGAGMFNGVLVDEIDAPIKIGGYGQNANIQACRSMFLGANAGAIANGTKRMTDGMGVSLIDSSLDHGHEKVIGFEIHFGADKLSFNGMDHGSIAVDNAFTPAPN